MDFPIYRKYTGIDVWFKIDSFSSFTEIKRMGQGIIVSEIKASIYPEKQFIHDMINCYENRWEIIENTTFNQIINAFPKLN